MPLVDLVVLDIAGTTVADPDFVGSCVQDALAAVGVELTMERINPIMGMPKPLAIRQLLDEEGDDRDVQPIYEDFVQRMKRLYREHPGVKPIDGVPEALKALRSAGVKVALDTGFSHDITDVILERLGWKEGFLDGYVSSDQVANGRPHPDMVHHHMEQFGISDPFRVAKVGDAPVDLQEGTAAHCRFVVGVLSGTHRRDQLEPFPHTHIIDSAAELPDLVLGEESQ